MLQEIIYSLGVSQWIKERVNSSELYAWLADGLFIVFYVCFD